MQVQLSGRYAGAAAPFLLITAFITWGCVVFRGLLLMDEVCFPVMFCSNLQLQVGNISTELANHQSFRTTIVGPRKHLLGQFTIFGITPPGVVSNALHTLG